MDCFLEDVAAIVLALSAEVARRRMLLLWTALDIRQNQGHPAESGIAILESANLSANCLSRGRIWRTYGSICRADVHDFVVASRLSSNIIRLVVVEYGACKIGETNLNFS